MFEQVSPYQAALHDFRAARQKAALQEVFANLTGKSNRLLSFDEVAAKLKLSTRADRGVQQVPLEAIIGSVGRYTDFTRTFLPRTKEDAARWARVKAAMEDPAAGEMPPIEAYKVGEAYFILDGNHRVSVARRRGMAYIDAHVIELKTSIPLTPDVTPDDLILKAEYADFLRRTRLDALLPEADLSLTVPGQYARLIEHIQVNGICCGLEASCGETCPEALVLAWYNDLYQPVITAIQERGLLRWFPGRTAADLYIWLVEYQEALKQELGWEVSPQTALTGLSIKEASRAGKEERSTGAWRLARFAERYVDHLFKDILVPLSGGDSCWHALEQALVVAGREGARVHGLHVTPSGAGRSSTVVEAMEARFLTACQEAEVEGTFLVESGEVARILPRRALLADLVVLDAAHPPAAGLAGLRSRLRAVIRDTFRPVLVVRESTCRMQRALLAFDSSTRSKEALFLAAYLAEQWKTSLTVLTILEAGRVAASAQEHARAYLELHELQAEYLVRGGSHHLLREVLAGKEIDLLVMGSYRASWLEEVTRGSLVNQVLREMKCPALICR